MREGQNTLGNSAVFLAGALCGAALTALLDGRSGAARRNWIRGKMVRGAHVSARFAGRQLMNAGNHVRGSVAEYWAMARDQNLPDDILLARVRAQLGHVCDLNRVEMEVHNGHVDVWGAISYADANRIGQRLGETRGVVNYYVQANDLRDIREGADERGIVVRERVEKAA